VNKYETVCIVRSDAGDELIKAFIQKATGSLESGGGTLTKLDEWGRRRLAYPIQKKNEGYYFVMEYQSAPEVSKEIERLMKLNENILRYQTVRIISRKPPKLSKKAKEKAAKALAAAEAAKTAPAPVIAEGGNANG